MVKVLPVWAKKDPQPLQCETYLYQLVLVIQFIIFDKLKFKLSSRWQN
jgi:hypothetical protein